jgi:hypothetical protein
MEQSEAERELLQLLRGQDAPEFTLQISLKDRNSHASMPGQEGWRLIESPLWTVVMTAPHAKQARATTSAVSLADAWTRQGYWWRGGKLIPHYATNEKDQTMQRALAPGERRCSHEHRTFLCLCGFRVLQAATCASDQELRPGAVYGELTNSSAHLASAPAMGGSHPPASSAAELINRTRAHTHHITDARRGLFQICSTFGAEGPHVVASHKKALFRANTLQLTRSHTPRSGKRKNVCAAIHGRPLASTNVGKRCELQPTPKPTSEGVNRHLRPANGAAHRRRPTCWASEREIPPVGGAFWARSCSQQRRQPPYASDGATAKKVT